MSEEIVLDARGLSCPLPVLKARKRLQAMAPGERLRVLATDPKAPGGFPALLRESGHRLIEEAAEGGRCSCCCSSGRLSSARQARQRGLDQPVDHRALAFVGVRTAGDEPRGRPRSCRSALVPSATIVAGPLELGQAAELGGVVAQQLDQLVDQRRPSASGSRPRNRRARPRRPSAGRAICSPRSGCAGRCASSGCGCAAARDGAAATGRGRRSSARPRGRCRCR